MEGVGCLTTSLFSEVVRFFFALALGRAGSEGRTTKPRVCRWPRPAWKALASTPAGLVALETRLWHVRSSRNSHYGTDGAAPPKPDLDCSIFCASRWQPAAGFLALEDFESLKAFCEIFRFSAAGSCRLRYACHCSRACCSVFLPASENFSLLQLDFFDTDNPPAQKNSPTFEQLHTCSDGCRRTIYMYIYIYICIYNTCIHIHEYMCIYIHI